MSKNIICFGEVLWDKYPEKTELGGAPFNVFSRLHSFGNNVKLISAVGDDKLGLDILKYFKKNNFETNHIYQNKYRKTGCVNITLNSGEPSYEILSNVAWDFIPFENKKIDCLEKIDFLVFGSLSSRQGKSFQTLKKLFNYSKFKILDLNLRQSFYTKEKLNVLLMASDFLKINMSEFKILIQFFNFNGSNNKVLLKKIYNKFNMKYVCLTNGQFKSYFFDGNRFYHFKPFKVNSIDNVGAGDNFLAAFINEFFIKNNNIDNSLRIASAFGALTASKTGANPIIKINEVKKLLEFNIHNFS